MSGERTERPSPHKLRQARRRGQVWRSRDLTAALLVLAAAGLLTWAVPAVIQELSAFMGATFREATGPEPPPPPVVLGRGGTTAVHCVAWFAILGLWAAVMGDLVQVRPLFSLDAIKPRWERLNPVSGLRRLVSWRGAMGAGFAAAKVLLVGAVMGWLVRREARNLLLLVRLDPRRGAVVVGDLLLQLWWGGAVVLLGLALLDALFQRYQYMKDQRMTKQEVIKEQREMEGDQSIKGERKRLHQELLEQAMLEAVRRAKVVIVNPTEIAVALGYQPEQDDAPVVLASGKDRLARTIVELARREGIPVLREIELARTLAAVEVGAQIPEELYEAVAAILRHVMTDE